MRTMLALLVLGLVADQLGAQCPPGTVCYPSRGLGLNLSIGRGAYYRPAFNGGYYAAPTWSPSPYAVAASPSCFGSSAYSFAPSSSSAPPIIIQNSAPGFFPGSPAPGVAPPGNAPYSNGDGYARIAEALERLEVRISVLEGRR